MTLEQITQTQWAALAHRKEGQQPVVAVESMRRFYSQFTIAGANAGEDPTISAALAQAINGAQAGHGIGNTGIGQAMDLYGGRYTEFYGQTSLHDIVQATINSGFNNLPQALINYITANPNMTHEQLVQAAQGGNQDAQRAVAALATLENQKFEGQLYPQVITDLTGRNLNALYPPTAPANP